MSSPMYRQIAEQLRAEIEDGSLRSGEQLPTEQDLQNRFKASRNTVRDAIRQLVTLGQVVTKPGQGTFVVRRIEPTSVLLSGTGNAETGEISPYDVQVTDPNRVLDLTVPLTEIQRASNDEASLLGIAKGEPIISRHRRLHIDETPWSMQTSFYPLDFVNRGALRLIEATEIKEGTVAYLEHALGIKQAGHRDVISVRQPTEKEAEFFQLPTDGRVTVIEIQRTALDQAGHPIQVTISIYPADRNKLIYEKGTFDIAIPTPQEGDAKRPEGSASSPPT